MRVLSDDERNILAEHRHEACDDHCADCGRCLGEVRPVAPGRFVDEPAVTVGDDTYCEDCAPLYECEHASVVTFTIRDYHETGEHPGTVCLDCGTEFKHEEEEL